MFRKLILSTLLYMILITQAMSADWQMYKAQEEYSQGNYSEALKTVNAVIIESSEFNEEALILRANIYQDINNLPKMIKDLDTLINHEPRFDYKITRAYINFKLNNLHQYDQEITDIISDNKFYFPENLEQRRDCVNVLEFVINSKTTPPQYKNESLKAIIEIMARQLEKNRDTYRNNWARIYQCVAMSSLYGEYKSSESDNNDVINFYNGAHIYSHKDKKLGAQMMIGTIKSALSRETDQKHCEFLNSLLCVMDSIFKMLDSKELNIKPNTINN